MMDVRKIIEVMETLEDLAQSNQRYRSYYIRDLLIECRNKLDAAISEALAETREESSKN
jgi:hypothetical protein